MGLGVLNAHGFGGGKSLDIVKYREIPATHMDYTRENVNSNAGHHLDVSDKYVIARNDNVLGVNNIGIYDVNSRQLLRTVTSSVGGYDFRNHACINGDYLMLHWYYDTASPKHRYTIYDITNGNEISTYTNNEVSSNGDSQQIIAIDNIFYIVMQHKIKKMDTNGQLLSTINWNSIRFDKIIAVFDNKFIIKTKDDFEIYFKDGTFIVRYTFGQLTKYGYIINDFLYISTETGYNFKFDISSLFSIQKVSTSQHGKTMLKIDDTHFLCMNGSSGSRSKILDNQFNVIYEDVSPNISNIRDILYQNKKSIIVNFEYASGTYVNNIASYGGLIKFYLA